MLSFPVTNPAAAAVFAHTSPERSTPIVSELQLEVDAGIKASQAAAKVNPLLNGEASRRAVRT